MGSQFLLICFLFYFCVFLFDQWYIIRIFFFFFGFPTGCPTQFKHTLTNPRSQWKHVAGRKVLHLLELELRSKLSQTPESYPMVDKPLGHT